MTENKCKKLISDKFRQILYCNSPLSKNFIKRTEHLNYKMNLIIRSSEKKEIKFRKNNKALL